MEQTHFSFCWSDSTTSCIILLFQQEEFDPLQLNQLERTCLPVHICIWPCCVGSLETVSFVFIIQSSWSPCLYSAWLSEFVTCKCIWAFVDHFFPFKFKGSLIQSTGEGGGLLCQPGFFFFKLHWIVFVENKR